MSVLLGTPGQQGQAYKSTAGLTWASGYWVPAGPDAVSIQRMAAEVESPNGDGDVANIASDGHHLVASGEFNFKNDASCPEPVVGLMVEDNEGRMWIVRSPVNVTNASATKRPMVAQLTLHYHPVLGAAEGGSDPDGYLS